MRPHKISTQYQSPANAAGTQYVNVNGRVYTTDNAKRYIASVRRNSSRNGIPHTLYECDANGNRIQQQIKFK